MKSKLIDKIENIFLFRFASLGWHLVVIVSLIGVAGAVSTIVWSLTPTKQESAPALVFPAKPPYPPVFRMSLSDLIVPEKDSSLPTEEKPAVRIVTEDDVGRDQYLAAYQRLVDSVGPVTGTSWRGAGHWTYPQGERYWQYYQDEQYRKWVQTSDGIDDYLEKVYKATQRDSYPQKKVLLTAVTDLILAIPESERESSLGITISTLQREPTLYPQVIKAITPLIRLVSTSMKDDDRVLRRLFSTFTPPKREELAILGKIEKVFARPDLKEENLMLILALDSFVQTFRRDVSVYGMAIDMFAELEASQAKPLGTREFKLFFDTFVGRYNQFAEQIRGIDRSHDSLVKKMRDDHERMVREYEKAYQQMAAEKEKQQSRAMIALGSAIATIVLIGTILTMLSIQRSVRLIAQNFTVPQPPKT